MTQAALLVDAMAAQYAHAARILSGEDHSLSHASLGKIIGTGIVLGLVHVLTGPDHLSALAAMTTNSSWKAFSLGIRWGCGHSLGLIIMAAIFFAAGTSFDLDKAGEYCNYVVGVFMIALGIWTMVHIKRKYRTKLKDAEAMQLQTALVPSSTSLAPMERGPSQRISDKEDQIESSPVGSFHLVDVHEEDHQLKENGATGEQQHADAQVEVQPEPEAKKKGCCFCGPINYSNPTTQRLTALFVGIVHGIAGPGGILGVLPAVVLHDWTKSVAYLASFCVSSIFIMGVFAALYGEVTGRLSRNSLLLEFRIGMFSAAFSLVVGVAWIVLQATGQMDKVFE
ncbi:TPA: hypothetical protein N0F65_009339 [Lagenidium giganteum]|uniref:Uncharacterized protein n=1 Tax=Lagenidium giganteum TaxID=4803 RepID=A0AAV2YJW7_9STRA|nr:TPA: hypothetical protein N0F65_009339 [Lagenidium giganteum]